MATDARWAVLLAVPYGAWADESDPLRGGDGDDVLYSMTGDADDLSSPGGWGLSELDAVSVAVPLPALADLDADAVCEAGGDGPANAGPTARAGME